VRDQSLINDSRENEVSRGDEVREVRLSLSIRGGSCARDRPPSPARTKEEKHWRRKSCPEGGGGGVIKGGRRKILPRSMSLTGGYAHASI